MLLRPYQAIALAGIQSAYRRGKRAPLLCAPTGSGKSAMVGYMLGHTRKRTLILCHRQELLEMISGALPVAHGVIATGRSLSDAAVHVGMVQTVARRIDKLPAYDWIISDECHLSISPTWLGILKHYSSAWQLGMSATPCRLDGRGLGEHFDEIVYGPSIRELRTRGYLSRCRVFAPQHQIETIKKSGADFNMEEAARAIDRPSITGSAVAHLRKLAPTRRTIVFCCNRAHAENVAAQFRGEGFSAANVDGSMTDAERRRLIADFRSGKLQVLVNVELLTTGFDCPEIECGIFLRPTQSLALYLQMVGRILRIAPHKEDALLLDCVGNVLRHGLPDADREWTLDGRPARTAEVKVKQCPQCFACYAPAARCPECGYAERSVPKRRVLVERAGELVELTDAEVERIRSAPLKSLTRGASEARLREIAKVRGFLPGWVERQMKFRGGAYRQRKIEAWRQPKQIATPA